MSRSSGWSAPFAISGHVSPRAHYFLMGSPNISLCGLPHPDPVQTLLEHVVGRKPSPTECSFCWEIKARLMREGV